jgi:hypothetical protein
VAAPTGTAAVQHNSPAVTAPRTPCAATIEPPTAAPAAIPALTDEAPSVAARSPPLPARLMTRN